MLTEEFGGAGLGEYIGCYMRWAVDLGQHLVYPEERCEAMVENILKNGIGLYLQFTL